MSEDTSKTTDNSVSKEEVEKHKTMAMLAYVIFFLPLITAAKDSKFAKFHANQALLVTLLYFAAGFLSIFLIGFLLYPVAFVLWIMGIMNASNGTMKRLPVIGGIDIIK
jgi:uncharacterized membrane protein